MALARLARVRAAQTFSHKDKAGGEDIVVECGQIGIVDSVSKGTGAILFSYDPRGFGLERNYCWISPDKLEEMK